MGDHEPGEKDLANVERLTQAGLTAIGVERIRIALIVPIFTATGTLA